MFTNLSSSQLLSLPLRIFNQTNEFYTCQQKHLDALNDGNNTFVANEDANSVWTVKDENGEVVAAIVPAFKKGSISDEIYDRLESVADVINVKNLKKAKVAQATLSQEEMNYFGNGNSLITVNVDGVPFLCNTYFLLRTDEYTVDLMKEEYERDITNNEAFAERAATMFAQDIIGDVTKTANADVYKTGHNGKVAVSEKTGKPIVEKSLTACLADDTLFCFDTKMFTMLDKASDDLKIIKFAGSLKNSALIGYDESGESVGYLCPVHGGDSVVIDIDGKQYKYYTKGSIEEKSADTSKTDDLKSEEKPAIIEKDENDVSFSLNESVEETRDLIAVHNISPAKLLKTLKLGGFPMPSIAVARASDGFNQYIKSFFEEHNIPVLEYEYGDDNARIKALNSLDDVKFSKETEKGVLENERRNNATARSVGRSVGESADKSGRNLYETAGRTEEDGRQRTDTASSRRIYAKNVRAIQGTEIRNQRGLKCEYIKSEHYTDDMRAVEEANKKQGLTTYFFLGDGRAVFRPTTRFRGAIRKNEVYIQCDHARYSPQQINKHELVHHNYNSEDVKKVREYINNNLTKEEKRYIINVMYSHYAQQCKGDVNKVFEEFVCDVLAGMNSYSVDFAEISQEYWGEHADLIDSYSANTYAESIDAGGASLSSQEYADTFYGKMAKEIEGIKQEKIGKSVNFTPEDLRSRASELMAEKGFTVESGTAHLQRLDKDPEYKKAWIDATDAVRDEFNNNGYKVPAIDITDAMRESVLYEGQPMYSIEKVEGTDKLYVKADRQVIEGATPEEWGASVENYINESIRQGKDVQFVAADGDILTITADTAGKAKFRNYVTRPDGTSTVMSNDEYRTKLNAESHIDELSAASKRGGKIVPDYKNHAFAKDGFNYRTAYFEDFDGQYYKVTLSVGKNGEINTVYNVGKIKEAPFPLVAQRPGTESTGGHKASVNSITDNSQDVNAEDISFSLEDDGEFDLFDLWEQKNKEFGTIKKGENWARDIDVPKKITKEKLVSQFARTMLEAGVTPDTAVSEFEKRVLDGTMTHEVITNDSARQWALNQIKYHGFEEAMNTWGVYTRDGNVGKKELALGMELYNQCITSGDVTNAMRIAAELVAEATHAGQTLQATRMLKLMTPDGQLYYLEKSIQKMNDEFKKKIGDKYENIKLNEDLMKKFLTEKDAEKRDEIYDDICQDIADQIPATLLDKWNSWRYLAMLGNPRTHVRNILGNWVFVLPIKLKNYIGAVIERVARVDESKRTKSLHKSKKAIEFAKNDFSKMQKVLQGENAKYAVTSDIEGKRTIFKTKWLEALRNKNFDWLEKEDMWFLKRHYVDALAQIITARKLDVNNIDEKTLDIARAYATREAQRATYRDANVLAEALNKLQKKAEQSDKKAVRATSVLLEGVMPFKKTPLNIAKQGVQYSPVGILTGVYKTVVKAKNGDMYSTADIIDDFAKGLTGAAIMLLGTFLSSLGTISGGDDENKKKKEFDKMVGEQSFSLNIGDSSYTIDWMTPACLPLFTGVELYELTKDDFKFADIVNALSSLTDPLLELSVFSGISGAIESAQYNDTNTLFAIGSDMTTSYLTQALPTIGGQLSRIIDENKREYYYTYKNSNLPKGVQNFIGQVSSKIPFASYLFEPLIDEWGREETYGGIVERTLENAVSPGYSSKKNYTKVDKEIKRLYESTGEADVLPVTQQKKYTESKVDYPMTSAQWAEAKRIRGQKSFELIELLLSDKMQVKLLNKETGKYQTKTYSLLSDDEKVRAIKKYYDDAGEYTKEQMLDKVKGNSKK